MNKKLIAAAVAAGLALPMVAQADVNVYGLAQLELASVDAGNGSEMGVIDSKNSRFGVRWSEDLGGGLSAIGEFEWAPNLLDANLNTKTLSSNTTTGTLGGLATNAPNGSGIYARQQWLGLKGAFGEFQIGTVLQPYKYSGGVKYDAFVATAAEARSGNGGMIKTAFGQGGYFSNALAYKNKFGSAQIWLAYSPEESSDANNQYPGAKGDLMASVVVGFAGGEVGVAYAKDNNKTGTTGASGEKNTKVFGKYSFGNSTVLAQYEQSKVETATDYKVYFLGYRLKMPAMNTLVAQVGQTKLDSGANPKTTYAAVGVIHNFSKKTRVFAAWRKTSPDGGNDTKVITLGLTEKF